jgi:hypothetical protein
MKYASFITLSCLLATFLATTNASFSDCRKKYSGNLAIKNTQVGINGKYAFLGDVSQGFTPVNFVFYECQIKGYNRSPDEYGFIIADGIDTSRCGTAITHNDQNSYATIDHYQCDYDGANKEQINRQLVYANYYRPNGGDAQIDITFQGSPKTETSTGFSLRHASFYDEQSKGIKDGSVIIDNQTQTLGYNVLSLHDVVIESSDSMVKGQITTNEQKIANDFGTNGFKLSSSAEKSYESTKKIF